MTTLGQFTLEATTVFSLSFLAFVVAMLLTPIYTYFAYKYKFWKRVRTESTTGELLKVFSKLHAEKHRRNIPTMAGIIMVLAAAFITVLFNLDRQQTWLPLAALIGGAWFFYYKLGYTTVHVPFIGNWELGWWLIPLFVLVVVSTGNAVNISDGLDGLAGGLLSTAYGAFGVIALLQGNYGIAGFCFTVVGVLLSYIWFNIYPARFFMGDVGSFALGTALGVVAMLTDTLFLLPIVGFVFVAEAGSSLTQILSKKLFKRKIFLSAPVHHHLEAIGWPEVKVTMRFWVIGQVCGALGLMLALAGGYIR